MMEKNLKKKKLLPSNKNIFVFVAHGAGIYGK